MENTITTSAEPLITRIQKMFGLDLAMENDFLRHENRILRSKLGKRITLCDKDRRDLVNTYKGTSIRGYYHRQTGYAFKMA